MASSPSDSSPSTKDTNSDDETVPPGTAINLDNTASPTFSREPLSGIDMSSPEHAAGESDADLPTGSGPWKSTSEEQYLHASSETASSWSSTDMDVDITDDETTVTLYGKNERSGPCRHSISPNLQILALSVAKAVMHEIYVLMKTECHIRSHAGGSSSTPASGISELQTASHTSASTSRQRKRSADNRSPDEDQEEDDQARKRPLKSAGPNFDSSALRFACPFFKHNPEANRKWRSCAGPGWASVHRVK
jgi:hypothetical protein